MKKYLTVFFSLLPLGKIKIFLLNSIGHKIHYSAKIGFSVIMVDILIIDENAKILHLNFIKTPKLHLKEYSTIKHLNYIKGYFDVILDSKSSISNQNKIRRAYPPFVANKSSLHIGEGSFIVSNHFLDLTSSVSIGVNSILAGIGTQIWTHGYYHADSGDGRIRIDGQVIIGDNVYVGSRCLFNPGVKVCNAIHIGGGSVISKDLNESGMYVGQGLRFIDNSLEKIKGKLKKVEINGLVENVYTKD